MIRDLFRLIAIIAVAIILGVNLANTFRPLLFLWYGPRDFVSVSEDRLKSLRETLPAIGEIGYVSDVYPGEVTVVPQAVQKFYLMQYALAPRVLIPTMNPRITVGDYNGPINAVLPEGVSVQDLGRGVVVIEQKEK